MLLIFSLVVGAFAQESGYNLSLSKDNISYYWLGQLQWDKRLGVKNSFAISNKFVSNLYQESQTGDKWKDENNLKANWAYRFNSKLGTAFIIRSHIFSDQNSTVQFNKHVAMQEVSFYPNSHIRVAPALGWAKEDIYRHADDGWYSQMKVEIRDYDMSGYINRSDAFSGIYFYTGRKNQEHRYFTSFNKKFSDFARDSIRVGYEYVQNSYYLARGQDLEDVVVNARFLNNHLQYDISRRSLLEVQTRVQTRDVSQSNPRLLNHRKELNFTNRVGFSYKSEKFRGELAFVNSQVTNFSSRRAGDAPEARTDIEGLQSAFNLNSRWLMSASDELHLTFSYTKYEYTSPDTAQQIDEDDLRFIISSLYKHRFSTYFTLGINGSVYLYHQIYISAERSANNNWNRIYQLSPSFHFTIPNAVEHTNRIKILANYTTYDFEDILQEVRSYIYRKLVYTDSLKIHLNRAFKLVSVYQLEKEDNGTFFKNIFAQQISRELLSHFLDISLVYARFRGWQLTSALNWYLRKEWNYAPDKHLIRNYRAFSPRISLSYQFGKNLLLHATFSPKVYRDLNIEPQRFVTGQFVLKYLF
ncbi:MAG: hypothetical protein Kow0042_10500 [Calditrichia bacterium]